MIMDELIFQGKAFIPGTASGEALVSREPLSFWGGYDWKTGEIIDRRHPLSGSHRQREDPGRPVHARLVHDHRGAA